MIRSRKDTSCVANDTSILRHWSSFSVVSYCEVLMSYIPAALLPLRILRGNAFVRVCLSVVL